MKPLLLVFLALFAVTPAAVAAPRPAPWTPPVTHVATAASAATAADADADADIPSSLAGALDKATYLQLRENYFQQRWDAPFNVAYTGRLEAIEQLRQQQGQLPPFAATGYWTPIGPSPIPNGQTTTIAVAVSGRVTAIVVHPTNPDIVYVGTAQGGVYRTLDGGVNWTPMLDAAASLAIGALALAPSAPSILYVGTGEANLSGDSFFGVGLYRIDNADSAPVLNGPFNPTPTTDVIGAKTFTGRSISQIIVNATDPAILFVSTSSGIGGAGGDAFGASPPITSLRGIYRSVDATSASPNFDKLTVTSLASIAPDATGNRIITDMILDPTDATGNTLLCWLYGNAVAGDGGIWRTTNALAASPVFTQTFVTTVNATRGTFAANRVGATTTIIVGTGEAASGTSCLTGNGCLRRSTDGGATWSAKLLGGGGYCGGQCWYDLPVAISPADANLILIGGAGNSTCSRVFARSTNAGASFTGPGSADVGLHADAHAIAFAPSNPLIVYQGNDGGIFRSSNGGINWTSMNTSGFSATQFMSIATHPLDPFFTIGGTQDNGTNFYQPNGTWTRADGGDGGFALIDQNATDSQNVTMYHTYFNLTNSVLAIARVNSTLSAHDGLWPVYGCGATPNGINCADAVLFYAPIALGPGNPNTVYYGSDRLYRSTDRAATMTTVSQGPLVVGAPISAIGISPLSDNVRVVGLVNGKVFATSTGSLTLTDVTGAIPAKFVARVTPDPTNLNTCYAALGGFGLPAGQHIWKTTDLSSATPTWVASGSGIPDAPVNAFVVDPLNPSRLWAGTDVGVYVSTDAGATWNPYVTGMPVVAVFDMSLQPSNRILRVATHGRGMWERSIDVPVATQLALVGAEIVGGYPHMTWYSADGVNETMNLYRRAVPGDWETVGSLSADGSGLISYTDLGAVAGHSYEYRIGLPSGATERFLGQVWVDVPTTTSFAVRVLMNAGRGALQFSVSLPTATPARLELVDVAGRRVAGLDVSGAGAGEHTVSLDTGAIRPGIYWARLSQAGKLVSARVALVR